jgi:hypothetical protein
VTGLPSRCPSSPPITSSSGFRYRLGLSDVVADAWRFDHDPRGSRRGGAAGSDGRLRDDARVPLDRVRLRSHGQRAASDRETRRGPARLRLQETTPEATSVTEITEAAAWWDVVIDTAGSTSTTSGPTSRDMLWRRTLEEHDVWRAAQDA